MNKPLTLEQLKEMGGKPVWVKTINPHKYSVCFCGWYILEKSITGKFGVWDGDNCLSERDYEKDWLAYAYPPAHIDLEAWKPCKRCKPSSKELDRFIGHDFQLDGAEIYYYDTENGWEGEEINFCPWCGRPLTEEAWEELEKRVRGDK